MKSNFKILDKSEALSFDCHPKYTALKRINNFRIGSRLKALLKKYNHSSRVYFLVRLVYFQSNNKFYNKVSIKDLKFASKALGIPEDKVLSLTLGRQAIEAHHKEILKICKIQSFNEKSQEIVIKEVEQLLKLHKRPRTLWRCLLDFLIEQKIEIPEYKKLESVIIKGRANHYENLKNNSNKLTKKQKGIIKSILAKEVHPHSKDRPGLLYEISRMKKINQSQRVSDIRETTEQYNKFKEYYFEFKDIIENYSFDNEGYQRMAIEFIKMDLSKINRLDEDKRQVYILCFIRHQFYKVGDHLVETFLSTTQKFVNIVRNKYKETVIESHSNTNQTFIDLIDVAEDDNCLIKEIKKIIISSSTSDQDKVKNIKHTLAGKINGRTKRTQKFQLIKEDLIGEETLYVDLLLENFNYLKMRVLKMIPLLEINTDTHLGESILRGLKFLSKRDKIGPKRVPTDFLKKVQKKQLQLTENMADLYRVFLILAVSDGIKSGQLNLKYSYKYKSIEDYLIPKDEWDKNKDKLLKQAGLYKNKNIASHLEELSKELNQAYIDSNESINTGVNEFLSFDTKNKVKIKTPATDYSTDNLLFNYFPKGRYIPLSEVLYKINNATGFIDHFFHFKYKYIKNRPSLETFIAGIIGLGCNIGHYKMAKISKDITESKLSQLNTWYFSPESVINANDSIINYMNELSLPNLLMNNSEKLQTSSDGMKWSVSTENIMAKRSYKYFGKSKGVSVNTHVDERHLALYSKIISTTDREATSVIDGLLHNEQIKSDIHSTDTHGYTESLFGVMHLLGFKFAPRIKGIKHQRIYTLSNRQVYKSKRYKILPDGNINQELVIDNWDEVLRFVATIKLKRTTSYQLFKRLNSYSKIHPLYKALKEYGKIYKSSFILEYINDVNLRQKIEKQLNKVEESNRLARAICFGNNQELIGKDSDELEVAEGCRRLIKNAIICWNYLYLTQKIVKEKDKRKRARILWSVKHSSILHYKHMNFHGEYDFSKSNIKDSQAIEHQRITRYNLQGMWDKTRYLLNETEFKIS